MVPTALPQKRNTGQQGEYQHAHGSEPDLPVAETVARALHQRIHQRIDLVGAAGDERQRQQRVGGTQQQDADANGEPLGMKPVGDDDMALGASAWGVPPAGEIAVPQGVENGTTPIVVGAPFLHSC